MASAFRSGCHLLLASMLLQFGDDVIMGHHSAIAAADKNFTLSYRYVDFSILSAPNSFCGVKSAYRYVSFFDPICFRFHLLKISTDNFFTFYVSICSIKYHFYCLNFLSGKRRRLQLKASPMLCE